MCALLLVCFIWLHLVSALSDLHLLILHICLLLKILSQCRAGVNHKMVKWANGTTATYKSIPANSHTLGVSLMPAGWKLRSHAGSRLIAGHFLTPDWKMWVVAVLLDTISKKYDNSDPCICKERKPCVKWINENTFLAISPKLSNFRTIALALMLSTNVGPCG